MEPDNPASPPSENISVHVEGDVSGQVAVGKNIVQIGQLIVNYLTGGSQQQRAQRNRQAMLELVRNTWIKGMLEQSLHNEVLIELGLEERPSAVEHPWGMVLQMPGQSNCLLPPGTKIVDVFDETSQALLILGEPGSGKTTMLLELARNTITRAEGDLTQPIPVVFNLSSWAEKRQTIAEWLVEELNTKYHVPKKIALPWVENDELLLLLDGLDEVKQEHRESCIKAINGFRQEHGLTPLAVCSRVADYETLTTRLELRGAVCIQPLDHEQVEEYFKRTGSELAAVCEMWQTDPIFQELVESPLMLNVMSLAYKGLTVEDLQPLDTVVARRRHVFATYVERMFTRRGADHPCSHEQTVHWLAWLARQISTYAQTIFLIEELQPYWLPTHAQRQAHRVTCLVFGLLGGLVGGSVGVLSGVLFGWPVGELVVGLFLELALGLGAGSLFGWAVGFDSVETVEILRWSWRKGLRELHGWLRSMLLGGLISGLSIVLALGLSTAPASMLALMLVAVLVFWLIGGLSYTETEAKTVPNQGIRQSSKNALISGLISGLGVGLVSGLSVLVGSQVGEMDRALGVGLFLELAVGLYFGFQYGGKAVILHLILRYSLHRHNCLPWRLVPFLDYATDRIFLRKVGGGYIFIHRLLQEHFASLYGGE